MPLDTSKTYSILNVQFPNQAVDLSGSNFAANTQILAYTNNTTVNQKWQLQPVSGKSYQFYIKTMMGNGWVSYDGQNKLVLSMEQKPWVISEVKDGNYIITPADQSVKAVQLNTENSQLSLALLWDNKQVWKFQPIA